MRMLLDAALETRIARLQGEVRRWARRHELWHDCDFFDYTERVKPVEWDNTAYALALAGDGPLSRIVIGGEDGYDDAGHSFLDQFDATLKRHGFWYENCDHTEMWIYATGRAFAKAFREYMRWKWICSLIKPEFDILDEELYSYFRGTPDALGNLHWRDFETIIAALMESQGYQVELGPGSGDGGVDVRLLQRDPIGDVMTLVQVKRYRGHRRIHLEAVQALHGAVAADGASKSMFVTTSTYSPSAQSFAARRNVPMTLHTTKDVQEWCKDACEGIVREKRRLVGQEHITGAVETARRNSCEVLHRVGGYGMVTNDFAVVLRETRTAALLLELPKRMTEHDGFGQRGREVPDLRAVPRLPGVRDDGIRRVRKIEGDRARLWDGRGCYLPWNGRPAHFDYAD